MSGSGDLQIAFVSSGAPISIPIASAARKHASAERRAKGLRDATKATKATKLRLPPPFGRLCRICRGLTVPVPDQIERGRRGHRSSGAWAHHALEAAAALASSWAWTRSRTCTWRLSIAFNNAVRALSRIANSPGFVETRIWTAAAASERGAVKLRRRAAEKRDELAAFDRSGKIEARIGLRMIPTFPRSPYHSVRRVFPGTAVRLAFRTGPSHHGDQLKPAPGMRWPSPGLRPSFARLVTSSSVRKGVSQHQVDGSKPDSIAVWGSRKP
jgi:hypothetical protein